MKKTLALVLALVMLLALCGCGSKPADTPAPAPAAEAPADAPAEGEAAEPKPFKIGFYDYSTQGATVTPQVAGIKAVCEALGGEPVSVMSTANNTAAFIEALNTMLSMDVNGVVLNFAHLGYSAVPTVAQMCNDAEVYFSFFYCYDNFPEEIQQILDNSEYYIGRSFSPEYDYGYEAAEALHNAGCDNIGYFGLPLNNDQIDATREDGIAKACEDYSMNYLAEVRDYSVVMSSEGAATQVENWLANYPEMDGILIGVLTPYSIPGVSQAILNSGRDVKIAVCECAPDMDKYVEAGQLVWTCGHNVNGATYLALATVNAIQGTPLSDSEIKIQDNVMYLDTLEDHKLFSPHVYDSVYTVEDLSDCLTLTNPEFSLDDLEQMSAEYNWDWWKARH